MWWCLNEKVLILIVALQSPRSPIVLFLLSSLSPCLVHINPIILVTRGKCMSVPIEPSQIFLLSYAFEVFKCMMACSSLYYDQFCSLPTNVAIEDLGQVNNVILTQIGRQWINFLMYDQTTMLPYLNKLKKPMVESNISQYLGHAPRVYLQCHTLIKNN